MNSDGKVIPKPNPNPKDSDRDYGSDWDRMNYNSKPDIVVGPNLSQNDYDKVMKKVFDKIDME